MIFQKGPSLSAEFRWRELEMEAAFGSFLRIDEDHPGDFYVSLDRDGRRGLVLVSDSELLHLAQLESLEIVCEQQDQGLWRTCIWLRSKELETLFSAFVEDLISSTRTLARRNVGVFTNSRIMRWRRLFELGASNLISIQELRGLVGELAVLKEIFEQQSPPDAVEGWCGPLNAPQDFAFTDVRIEVKTVGPTALRVRVGSVDQLDIAVGQQLFLAVVVLAPAALDNASGFAASGQVAEIRSRLVQYPHAADEFNSRLRAVGYDDQPEYEQIRFSIEGIRYYSVEVDFPRLIRRNLVAGISDASYEIEFSAIQRYMGSLQI